MSPDLQYRNRHSGIHPKTVVHSPGRNISSHRKEWYKEYSLFRLPSSDLPHYTAQSDQNIDPLSGSPDNPPILTRAPESRMPHRCVYKLSLLP